MRQRLNALLQRLRDALDRDKRGLRKAHRRFERKRRVERNLLDQAQAKIKRADGLRADAQKTGDEKERKALSEQAARADKAAQEKIAGALKASQQMRWWLGRIKTLTQRIHGLELRAEEILERIENLPERGELQISVERNEVRGGTLRQRVKAAAMLSASRCAAGKRANFYSQPGRFTADACFTGESSSPLERSDCSQWFASVYHAAGLPDPNGANYSAGYTGTLIANGREIRRDQLRPGDAIIYGTGTGFHVEMFIGEPGIETIGHGSAPIDPGIIDLASPRRYFSYID